MNRQHPSTRTSFAGGSLYEGYDRRQWSPLVGLSGPVRAIWTRLQASELINRQMTADSVLVVDLVQRRFLLFADRTDLARAARVKHAA